MKVTTRTVQMETYVSEVEPQISTTNEGSAKIIAWADAHPVVYRIVCSGKSRAFGSDSSDHMGWARRSQSAEAVLERITTVQRALEDVHGAREFWRWRAGFTLEHFGKKGFTGGYFQQHALYTDGKEYPRHCVSLDYTPETLEEVIDRFVGWMGASSCRYDGTTRITVDNRNVREFAAQ